MGADAELSVMSGHVAARAEMEHGLRQLVRERVDARPAKVVLSVFEKRKVDAGKSDADPLEPFVVSAVATKIDFARRRLNQERRPERLVAHEAAPRKVERRQAVKDDVPSVRARQFRRLSPVELDQHFRVEAPVLEMFADAQRTHDASDAIAQGGHGAVVEMVPMVVRDGEHVDFGNVGWRVDVGSGKGFAQQERNG